jgi:uncharacterized protein YjaG (DUF416 family)
MQIYLSFTDDMNKLIYNASHETKLGFALDICKKLYPEYQSFASKHNFGDVTLLQKAIEFCEKSAESKHIDMFLLDSLIEEVEEIMPDTEDFTDWKAAYALNAAQSVYELLMFIKDTNNRHIADICSLVIDTIDFKIAETNAHISDDDGIYKHPLMVETMRELKEKINK